MIKVAFSAPWLSNLEPLHTISRHQQLTSIMHTTRPTLRRDFSCTRIPQSYASPAYTQSTIFGSASPSSQDMASPSSTASTPPTTPGRLRRENAPTYIALPTSSPSPPIIRNRARSNTLNTPLVFDAGGTVVFGIRTPTFEARTPAPDSPDGRPAHRAGLATLNRVVSNEQRPTTIPQQSYFDNVVSMLTSILMIHRV